MSKMAMNKTVSKMAMNKMAMSKMAMRKTAMSKRNPPSCFGFFIGSTLELYDRMNSIRLHTSISSTHVLNV